VTFAWQDEASTINESTNPSYQLRELHARKLVALHKVTKELMADSPGFMTHLVNLLGRAAAYEVDAKLWSGNGTTQPLGHLNATGVITASRTTSSRFKVFDLETLDSGLDEAFTEGYLFMRKATQADLINDVHVPYSGAGATDGLPRVQIVHNQIEEPLTRRRQLNGYPVIITKHAPALGTTGDVTLMDPRSILVGVRETFEISTSTEAYWTTDILGVKLTARMDAQPIYPAGVVHLT
jgi:HK97 family phage major capsid protein